MENQNQSSNQIQKSNQTKQNFMNRIFDGLLSELSSIVENALRRILPEFIRNTEPVPEIMNMDEAAKFLKLPKNTLYSYTSHRLIPFCKPKGCKHIRFLKSSLEKWMAENEHKTRKELEEGK